MCVCVYNIYIYIPTCINVQAYHTHMYKSMCVFSLLRNTTSEVPAMLAVAISDAGARRATGPLKGLSHPPKDMWSIPRFASPGVATKASLSKAVVVSQLC